MTPIRTTATASNLERILERARTLFTQNQLRQAEKLIEVALEHTAKATGKKERAIKSRLYEILAEINLRRVEVSGGIGNLARSYDEDNRNENALFRLCNLVMEHALLSERYLPYLVKYCDAFPQDKKMTLILGKHLLQKGNLNPLEEGVIIKAVRNFPAMWKPGSDYLFEKFLRDGRKDETAFEIYRNAFYNHRDNTALLEILIEPLLRQEKIDEFAVDVFLSYQEYGTRPDYLTKVKRILANFNLEKKRFSKETVTEILNTVDLERIEPEKIEALVEFVLSVDERDKGFDKEKILIELYDRGIKDHRIVSYLLDTYTREERFDKDAEKIFAEGHKQGLLKKHQVKFLTEVYVRDRNDSAYATDLFESYVSFFPERPIKFVQIALAKKFVAQKRIDETARKIYETALQHVPDDKNILEMLAMSNLSYEVTTQQAFEVYEKVYDSTVNQEIKDQIASILARHFIREKVYDRTTYEFFEHYFPIAPEREKERVREAILKSYLNMDRRDRKARELFLEYFNQADSSNPRLVEALTKIYLEDPKTTLEPGSTALKVYEALFDINKYSCDSRVTFALSKYYLEKGIYEHFPVFIRSLEADRASFISLVRDYDYFRILNDIGNHYLKTRNYQQVKFIYELLHRTDPSDKHKYYLAKSNLMTNKLDGVAELLGEISAPEYVENKKYWIAVHSLLAEDYDQAETLFTSLSSKEIVPGYLLKTRFGMISEGRGQLEDALNTFDDVLKEDIPAAVRKQVEARIVSILTLLGRYSDAFNRSQEFYRLEPTDRLLALYHSLAVLFLGYRFYLEENEREYKRLFLESINVNPTTRILRDVITDLFQKKAEDLFSKGFLDKSIATLRASLEVLPKRIDTNAYLGVALHFIGNLDLAIMHYSNILRERSDDTIRLFNALAHFEKGNFSVAWNNFHLLAEHDRLELSYYPLLIQSFLSDPDATETNLFGYLKVKPLPKDFSLGLFFIKDGTYDAAVEIFKDLHSKDPLDLKVLWFLGQSYSKLDKKEMAVHSWKIILDLARKQKYSREELISIYLQIGLSFLSSFYLDEAEETWKTLAELDPENKNTSFLLSATTNMRGYMEGKGGFYLPAIKEWEKTIQQDGANWQVLQNVAIAYTLMGELGRATTYWNRLLRIFGEKVKRDPIRHANLKVFSDELQKFLTDQLITSEYSELDLKKVYSEDQMSFARRANSFYWILGLDKTATGYQIERAYFRLIKIFNPERHPDDFMLLEESYANLLNQNKRASVDIFAFNPVEVPKLKERVLKESKELLSTFVRLPDLKPPKPDPSKLPRLSSEPEQIVGQLKSFFELNPILSDWDIV